MKPFVVCALALLVSVSIENNAQAQYKAPSQYFPKNYPAPQPGSGGSGRSATNAPALQMPMFKDLSVNTGFYFKSDTNRTYLWTKTSTTQAKNTKNGIVQNIGGETPVQR